MGTALGANWLAGGARVVTCAAGRSERTRGLVAAAGIDTVASLDDVVAADIVVSVVPPGAALATARDIAAAAARTGHRPLVADLNAIAPATLRGVRLALAGLDLVDGSISGPPPAAGRPTRVYLSGPHADRLAALTAPWLEIDVLPGGLGAASALKMCTASMYKGSKALVLHAMLTAREHGVLDEFLADVAREWPEQVPQWHTDIALAATKAARFTDEMREIATTQAEAGLPAALFDGVAAAYERVAATPLGHQVPEAVDGPAPVADVLAGVAAARPERPDAVLFDFSGTLFHIESAAQAVLAALGPDLVSHAPRLAELGAINGSSEPAELPAHLADVWERRDLSAAAHRAAYSGLSLHAGLSDEQAAALYDRGVEPEAWHPYPDTVRTLRRLHDLHVPVALISNIGWDPRPVLARYGVDDYFSALVLSDEVGAMKPDPAIFAHACDLLGVEPARCVMVGDNPTADRGCEALGIRFVLVPAAAAERAPGTLLRAAGLEAE